MYNVYIIVIFFAPTIYDERRFQPQGSNQVLRLHQSSETNSLGEDR